MSGPAVALYRLAAQLGRWDVAALAAEVPAGALMGWVDYWRQEAGPPTARHTDAASAHAALRALMG